MCFGVNVGLDTRCVHRKFQVCRLRTKKSYIRKIVRKEKSLKPGNVQGYFARPRKIARLRGSALAKSPGCSVLAN